MDKLNIIQKIVIMAPPLVFAIVLHEVAHGWIANKLGDHTARDRGRLTLNPISHIDLFGTIIMPVLLYVSTHGRFMFGYAKPVPINPYNFKDPKKGMAFSSLAGPGVNIVMAITFSFFLRVVLPSVDGFIPRSVWESIGLPLILMLSYGVLINVGLALLNLIPIPPLDGSRIVYWLLPDTLASAYYRLERYGMLIILALLAFNILGYLIWPIMQPALDILLGQDILTILSHFLF
ncbi:MAG TPA: site-2 protease family protein [Nitrospirota bacterium]|nr:site-2 protease family protein [Nitrospirota bacterium]